ncbi:uncharacterized protein LOC110918975 [Helianthus annuus]|uniref:uncharacterized protein LOC110918975 n=1 Tax=Helianthus annuus TaxID=4232 RepID=UPI001652F264|nr:uncharacterized protein LOC110918975 [Helianthus annuus]
MGGGVWCNISRVLFKQKVDEIPLRNFFKSKVGNGDSTAFWLDPWLGNEPLKFKMPELFKLEKCKNCKVSDRVKAPLGSSVFGHEFVWDWRRNISAGVEVDELAELYSNLSRVSLGDGPDRWEWIGAEDNQFSVGAVKRLLNSQGQHNSLSLVPLEECKWIPEKLNIFMWRSALNKIATVEALHRRNIQVQDDRCGLCNEGDDSVDHIFCSCYVASVVWGFISRWCSIQNLYFFSFKDIMEAHNFVGLFGIKKEVFKGIIRIVVWCIWKARNKKRFEGKEARIGDIINDVKALGFLWFKNRGKCKNVEWIEWCKFVF